VEDHPTTEDFRSLLQQSSQPRNVERNALAVRHLLADCEVCRAKVQSLPGAGSLLARMFDLQLPDSSPAKPATRYNYDWAFARAERTLAQTLAHGMPSERLPERLAELDRLPEGEQIRRVGAGGRFSDPDLIECLLDRSHAARYQSPRRTLHLALLARLAATACTVEKAGSKKALADLQAQAWGGFANARRICGNLLGAEDAFVTAFQKCAAGSGEPRIRGSLLSKLAALRVPQRRFDPAIKLIEKAERIFHGLGDLLQQRTLLVQKAHVYNVSGKPEAAFPLLQEALSSVDRDADPYLFLIIRHNLFYCYVDLNQPDEALALHVESRDLYQECKDLLILLRATWQEGRLLGEIGHLHNAEAALIRARQGFMEQGLAYETAMVSLDLADVYWRLGRFENLRRTLGEALPIFRSLRVSREVLASLLRLQQAAEEETAGESPSSQSSASPLLLFPGAPPRKGGPDDL
jgi:tetratricopeptide (TPR) repeat protein